MNLEVKFIVKSKDETTRRSNFRCYSGKLGSEGIDSIQLNEYSKDKKLVLIGVPGAFTPNCSVNHVPGFIEKADEILTEKVDEIICISVTNLGLWMLGEKI